MLFNLPDEIVREHIWPSLNVRDFVRLSGTVTKQDKASLQELYSKTNINRTFVSDIDTACAVSYTHLTLPTICSV